MSLRSRAALAALSFLVLLVALAAGGSAAGAGPVGATLSIDASKHYLIYKQAVTITGTLEGELPDDSGETVELWAKPFPYDTATKVDETTTDADGNYSFTAKPGYNTRYYAVEKGISGAQS